MPLRCAFTLIELLVVISIMAILAGMAMPMVGQIQHRMRVQNTQNLMRKIDVGIRLFKEDVGAFPWRDAPGSAAGPWGNDLAFRLMVVPGASERTKLSADLAAIDASYRSGGGACVVATMVDQDQDAIGGAKGLFDNATVMDGTAVTPRAAVALLVNRLATERARIAVLSGNMTIRRTVQNAGAPWVDGSQLLSSVQSRGLTGDYLRGDVERREVSYAADGTPDAFVDRWGRPLVYAFHQVNGVLGFTFQTPVRYSASIQVDASWFGLGPRQRAVTTSLASDLRTHASPAFAREPELWSSGRDGRFDGVRDAAGNADNLALAPYLKGMR